MIVCIACEDVLYFGTMPDACAELERVLCPMCQHAENEFENMAFDWANDR